MAAADYTSLVQSIYISYFGRPADTFGLANFSAQLDALKAPTTVNGLTAAYKTNAGVKTLVDSFGSSAESIALYGNDTVAFVSAIYNNVLNRAPDFDGLVFWVNAINSGSLTKANASLAIMAGAINNTSAQGQIDAAVLANKVVIATNFTAAIDTGAELNAYNGNAAAAVAREMLKSVTATTTPAAFQPTVEATIVALVDALAPVTNQNLSIGIDNFVGTGANDTINALSINSVSGADAATLGAFDIINGGAGKDTLNIFAKAGINTAQQGTVSNVEVINIFNEGTTAAAQFGGTTGVDASKFAGATAIWQVGPKANAVINLGNSTVAGFENTTDQNIAVTAAGAAAAVALKNVSGAASNAVTLDVAGANLAIVNVSGSIVKNDAANTASAKVNLNVHAGDDVTAVTVNTALRTTLTVTNGDEVVSNVNAAASAGAITYAAANTVDTISTGSGADVVTMTSVLAATEAGLLITNAGNDTLNVAATGAAGATVTADAGAGNDKINLTFDSAVTYHILGGAGDDTVAIGGATLKTSDIIDGGDGVDTISMAGKTTYVDDDYIVFTKLLKNFENVKLAGAAGTTTAIDASKMAGYKSFTFDSTGNITKVAADQSLITSANLTAQANGYTLSSTTAAITGNGITVTANASSTITAKAATVALNVVAGEDAPVAVALAGNVKTATVNLTNGINSDDSFSVATLNVNAGGPGTATAAAGVLASATSLVLNGNGTANVSNASNSTLLSIDATNLNSINAEGSMTTGLNLVSSATAAETIKLGGGIDNVTLNASTYGAVDTVSNLKLFVNTAGTALAGWSDVFHVGSAFTATKFVTAQNDIDLALKDAAASTSDNLVFAFGGDTYVFRDAGTLGSIDAADTVVKIVGTVSLDALIVSLNTAVVI